MSALPQSDRTIVTLPFEPHEYQQHAIDRMQRFNVLVAHRRFGKTVLSLMLLVAAALKSTLARPRFGYLAPFRVQAKAIAWDYLAAMTKDLPRVSVNSGELWVELHNGARIRLFGADNADAMRGLYFDGVVLDEVAQMRPNVWGEIVRPTLSDRKGWSLFIGTPKGVNLFSEMFYEALKRDDWYAEMFPASRTGIIPPAELEAARETMTDAQYRQEYECDFQAAAENALIPLELAVEASRRTLREEDFQFAAKVAGVDVAREGGDRSVIVVRQGLAMWDPVVMRGADNMEVAARVAHVWRDRDLDAVFIDNSPASYGVIDRLRQLGFDPIPVDFGGKAMRPGFANRRSEIWCGVREWLDSGAAIPDNHDLIVDLCAPLFKYSKTTGKFLLESKEEMRARGLSSPDIGDALAVTFDQPVEPSVAAIRLAIPKRHDMVESEWNPLEDA